MKLSRIPERHTWCDYGIVQKDSRSRTVIVHRDTGEELASCSSNTAAAERFLTERQLRDEIRTFADVYRFFALVRRMDPTCNRISSAQFEIEGEHWRPQKLSDQIDAIASRYNTCSGPFLTYLYQLRPELEKEYGRAWMRALHKVSLEEAGYPLKRKEMTDDFARRAVADEARVPLQQVELVRPGVCRVLAQGQKRDRYFVSHYGNGGNLHWFDLPNDQRGSCFIRCKKAKPVMYLRDGDFFTERSSSVVYRAECCSDSTLLGRNIKTGRTSHFFAFDTSRFMYAGSNGAITGYYRHLSRIDRRTAAGRVLLGEYQVFEDEEAA
jgi:hypothetical protein